MEEGRYWMLSKTRPDRNLSVATNSYSDSWEEQAFAFDAAGTLGGCVWPPRSYSCSFCRREFKSAQALGGHMNVHRRERARLKQSPTISSTTGQLTSLFYKNPNPEISDHTFVSDPRNISIRVPSPPATKDTSPLCFFSPVFQKNLTHSRVSSTHPPWSSFVMDKKDHVLDPIENEEKKSDFIADPNSTQDCPTVLDLSVSLDLEVYRTDMNGSNDEEAGGCKRRRVDSKPSSFVQESSKKSRFKIDVCKLHSGSIEELDLELRLGEAPKVK